MGRDEHISKEAVTLNFFNKEHQFHVLPDDFPLPEERIIGLKFFTKYDRYAITPKFLVLDKIKLPLHEDGNFIPAKTSLVFQISVNDENQDVLIIDQESIPDGIYRIDNSILKVPFQNHSSRPVEVTDKVNLRSQLPNKNREFSLQETEKLLKKGIIRESQFPFNSPLWVVPKKGNKLRMVIDYRKINQDTDQDAYPLPIIDDILDQLGKAKFFSAFDLSAGFLQIPMKEEDKRYTAFSTSQGHFEYNRMPFGLKNALLLSKG